MTIFVETIACDGDVGDVQKLGGLRGEERRTNKDVYCYSCSRTKHRRETFCVQVSNYVTTPGTYQTPDYDDEKEWDGSRSSRT